MKFYIAALCLTVVAADSAEKTISVNIVDKCTCQQGGNYYSPNSDKACGSFLQRTAFLPAQEQSCPSGLIFDVQTCVCNWPDAASCPTECPTAAKPTPNEFECRQSGNIYSPVIGSKCEKFTQATKDLAPQEHSCPAGLQFNINSCVCDWPFRTTCPN